MKNIRFILLMAFAVSLFSCTEKIEKDGPDGPECQISADDLIGKWNVIGDRCDLENGTSACYLMDDNSPDGYAHDEDGNLITITVKEYCQQYAEDYNADPSNEVKGTAEDFADKLYSYYDCRVSLK